ncbi:MAG: polysaccharide deacetylase [Phenylobacterium sp.]
MAVAAFQRFRLSQELRRWRKAGRQARLWWRDDDARAATPALNRLLAIAVRRSAPLTLAVIPDGDLESFADWLEDGAVEVVQHGVDHRNRRAGPEAGEFPHDWSRKRLVARLRTGWRRIAVLPGALPVFVPPWNDIHPELPTALEGGGYVGWSAWAGQGPQGGPPRVDAHLDLLRWRGGPRFRGAGRLFMALREALKTRRLAGDWQAPIGLLSHHLDHDPAAWRFLDWFLAWTAREPALLWLPLSRLLGATRRAA